MGNFNVKKIRADFPNLNIKVHDKPLVYLDNAATTFKPQSVIDAIESHYSKETSNVHRGVHTLSEKATAHYEGARVKIQEFLNQEHVGRISSIDEAGFPQIIPMNFVFLNNSIYMHSHTRGEKLDNVRNNAKVGFEVDKELEFLPSYFSDPKDASLADTLYISVVIKGKGIIIEDRNEKTMALNALMRKYQPEGKYEPLTPDRDVIDAVAIIKVAPYLMTGKYKIGQHMRTEDRIDLAEKIYERNTPTAIETLKVMGFEVTQDGLKMVDEPAW